MSSPWFTSLRGRFMSWYVAVIFAALAAFGAAAVFVIDRELHAALDARLRTIATAALNEVDVHHGRTVVDKHDREQILGILGSQTEVAVIANDGSIIFSSMASTPPDVVAQSHKAGFATGTHAGEQIRLLAIPIAAHGEAAGSIVVWSATTWIPQTDHKVAAAFAISALLLAIVASLAGAAVARRALDDALARQRRFTADASHELRAPLSVIRAEADLALRKPRDAEKYQAAIATIASEADRMEQLVRGLLSAARGENASPRRSVVELRQLAQRVCERLASSAAANEITLTLRDGEPCSAMGSEEDLERAVTAVVHNAIKHTPKHGRIDVWTARNRRRVEVCVQDGGPGFSPQALAHALEWFWSDDTSRSGEASGLGLAIADSVARASGGEVRLANAPHAGAQVVISLPAG
jgi:signal transduction histidine kinase